MLRLAPDAALSPDLRYRGPPLGVLKIVALDAMTAIFDRRSGQTHVVAAVVPAILDAVGQDDLAAIDIADRLGVAPSADLDDRLRELAGCGLLEAL
jgi:hypothetical protein